LTSIKFQCIILKLNVEKREENITMSPQSSKLTGEYKKLAMIFLQEKETFNGGPTDFSEQISYFYDTHRSDIEVKCNLGLAQNFKYNMESLALIGFVNFTKLNFGIYEVSITDKGRAWSPEENETMKLLNLSRDKKSKKHDSFGQLMNEFSIPGMTMSDTDLIRKVFNAVKPFVNNMENTANSKQEELDYVYEENSKLTEEVERLKSDNESLAKTAEEARCHSCEEIQKQVQARIDQIQAEANIKIEEVKEEAEMVKRQARQEVIAAADKYRIHIQDAQNKVRTGESSVHIAGRS